jgi:uncharacterized membrane protein (GlpM family)
VDLYLHSPILLQLVKNARIFTSIPQYSFMVWCSVKHRNNFMYTFYQIPLLEDHFAKLTHVLLQRGRSPHMFRITWAAELSSLPVFQVYAGFQVTTAMKIQVALFCVVMSCNKVVGYQKTTAVHVPTNRSSFQYFRSGMHHLASPPLACNLSDHDNLCTPYEAANMKSCRLTGDALWLQLLS